MNNHNDPIEKVLELFSNQKEKKQSLSIDSGN